MVAAAASKDVGDLLSRQLLSLPAFRALLRSVESRFYEGIKLPEPTLDLGCGDAHFALVTFDQPLAAGVDPWLSPLIEAKGRGAHRVLAQADGAALPFPTGHFASAFSNSVLEHIRELDPVLSELARVLQPGAPFVFCVPGERFLEFLSVSTALRRIGFNPAARAYESFFNRISRHHHCDAPDVWRERLMRAGFRIERSWYYFSRGALRALEWGHYLGLPAALSKALTDRWILWPSPANLWLTHKILRPFYEEPLPNADDGGAYLFFITHRVE